MTDQHLLDHDRSSPRTRLAAWRHIGTPLDLLVGMACVIVIIGIWLVTIQRVDFERDQAVRAAMQSNGNLAIAFEQQLFRTFSAAAQVGAFVREQYLRNDPDLDLRAWAEKRVIREEVFNIISVVDETGAIVNSSRPVGAVNYADREFFVAQQDNTEDSLFVSPPVLGRVSGRWQVPMSLRITRDDGSFAGVIVMSVDPARLTDFYHQAGLGFGSLLELTGLDGIVRSRKTDDQNTFGDDASALPWFERQPSDREGALIDDGNALDGVKRIVSYLTMRDYPLIVAVGTAYSEELAPAMQRRTTYLLVASAASAALLFFTALLILILARQRAVSAALRASEALFRTTFHQAAMGIAHIAPDGRILRANEKFCDMLGYREDELRARTIHDLGDEAQREEARQFLAHRLSSDAETLSPEIEKTYRRKDGSTLWACEALGVVRNPQGQPDFLVAIVQDITARKNLEARLSHDALHDPLTGLPNRVMFTDRCEQVLKSARRHSELAAILYLDLDGFKAVNDTRGHATGDILLQQVARRLEQCVRAEDTVARIGGDEFGIVLASLSAAQDCETVARKVIAAISAPFDLDGGEAHISASAGVALFPQHGHNAAMLIVHADNAMYAAKRAGKARFNLDVPLR